MLIVEDDAELRGVLARGLREEGFAVDGGRRRAARCSTRVERAVPDVLVIDIGLPDADGRDVCQALRARGVQTPGAVPDRARRARRPRLRLRRRRRRLRRRSRSRSSSSSRGCRRSLRRSGGERRGSRRRGCGSTRSTHARRATASASVAADADRVPAARARCSRGRARRCAAASSCAPAGRTARSSATTRSTPTSRACGASCASSTDAPEIATVHGVGYRIG